MNIKINKKYLIFPVNTHLTNKKVFFLHDGKSVYSLNVKLDNISPDFYAYIDVSRFIGETLEIVVCPEMDICYRESDEMDITDIYKEVFRPQVHFSTKNGWINDPNGLLYMNGIYHMFYQYNPTENKWNNMHWGHATSIDLIHWEEKDIALFPGDKGAIFSGGAIVDKNNLLGVAEENQQTGILFYTSADSFLQCMAYSTDNFETIRDYEGNPIVPNICGENRDPKVVYCEELNSYIMVIYLSDDEYCILKSENLINWSEIQRIHMPGDNECPDIFYLTDKDGNKKWILFGAHDTYYVGQFENGKYVPCQPNQTLHFGASAYAGQTFSNLPNGRVVRMVWDRWHINTPRISGQMGIPMELTLEKKDDIYYVLANPVAEIKSLYRNTHFANDVMLDGEHKYTMELEDTPYLIKLNGRIAKDVKLNLNIFGISIEADFALNQIKLGDEIAPISLDESFDVTLIVDRCSVELFMNKGRFYMASVTEHTIADRNIPKLTITANSKYNINELEVNSLNSIWG